MSSSRINVFTKAFRIFKRTSEGQRKETVKLIGQDHLGNKYFEANKPAHIRPVQRYFERPDVQSFDAIVDAAHVPPAWDAWLRFRRQEPPSKEEVDEGEEYYKMQQAMAAQKKIEAELESQKDRIENPAKNPKMPKRRSVPPNKYENV